MLFGRKKPVTAATPLGDAELKDEILAVKWRHQGLTIQIVWRQNDSGAVQRIQAIQADFDRYWRLALEELEVNSFEERLEQIIPDQLWFDEEDAKWTLCFGCPQWEDATWGVTFQDGKPVDWFHGD